MENNPNIEEMHRYAREKTRRLHDDLDRLCWTDLHPLNPEDYYEGKKNREPFREPKQTAKRDADREAGITYKDRLFGRFYNAGKAQLEGKEVKAKELQERYSKIDENRINKERELYYRHQEREHQEYDLIKEKLRSGKKEQVIAYLEDALYSDDFSTDGENPFEIKCRISDYKEESGELFLCYRIPRSEEINAVRSYVYDDKVNEVVAKRILGKFAKKYKLHIARSLLLRAVAMVYRSDAYEKIRTISIIGCVEYYDTAFGREIVKNVMKMTISRDIFKQISLETADVDDLFDRILKHKEAPDLYNKEEWEVKEIN